METVASILRCGSIGGRGIEPLGKKAASSGEPRLRPRDTHAMADEIEMCLNCKKNIKNRGCGEEKFLACSREMRKRKGK